MPALKKIFLLPLFIFSAATLRAADPSPLTLPQLIDAVKTQESKLQTLQLTARIDRETYDPATQQWIADPKDETWTAGTLWVENRTNGKIRFDLEMYTKTTPKTGLPTALSGESAMHARYGFDGTYGYTTAYMQGSDNKIHPRQIATKTSYPDHPGLHSAYLLLGHSLSIYFFNPITRSPLHDVVRHPLSEALIDFQAALEKKEPQLTLKMEEIAWENNPQVVHLSITFAIGNGQLKHQLWLDAQRGYALLAYRQQVQSPEKPERLLQESRTTTLQELLPGLWYPSEGFYTMSSDKRYRYKAETLTANAPVITWQLLPPPPL